MAEKVTTLHPAGKAGTNIDKGKYDLIKNAIVEKVRQHPGITFSELTAAVHEQLGNDFDGSIPWYVTTVKLDLEARGLIERLAGSSPQQLRLV